MTAHELLRAIHDAGGRVSIADGCQLAVEGVPKRFVPELKRLKAEILRHLRLEDAANAFSDAQFVGYGFDMFLAALKTDPIFQRLIERFNLKVVPPKRLKEVENGREWRPVSASNLEPANQPPRQPAKQSWMDGLRCTGCQGTWHSEETLAAHMLNCPLVQRTRR